MMQSLKANPFNREQQDETPLNKTVAQGEATKTKETKYPEIWRTAFAIRENVRFTRTPDVAMPKRAEALEKALNEKAVDDSSDKILNGNEQKSSSASGTTQVGAQYGQKTASHTMQGAASLRPQATFGYPAIRNPLILNRAKVKTPETVPEVLEEVLEEAVEEVLDVDMIEEAIVPNADLSHILPFNEDDNPAVIDGLDDEVVEETEITVSKNPILISDFAFFECGPFTLNESDTLAEQANDNATMNHDIIAHDAALPEVGAQNAPVANQAVNEQQSIHEQTSQNISVSEMFKVLECRLSHANSSSVNHQESTPESVLEENTPEGTLETEPALNDEVLPFEEGDDADLTAPIFDNVSNDIETGDIETPNIETLNADDFDAIFGADDQSDEGNQADTEDDITALLEADDAQDNDQSQDEDDFDFIEAQDDVETVRAETKQVSPQPSNQASPQASGQPAKTVVIARPNLSDMSVKPMVKTVASGPYQFPSIDLLQPPVYQNGEVLTRDALERSAGLLESVLEDFGIKGEIIQVRPGPVVTLYEFEPAAGVKSSRVIALSDDIARSMSAISARVAVIPGRNVIGIELPNATRETVYLREIVQSHTFADSNYKLALALGKSINGEPVTAELAKMPHLLVAGTTGSGKSVAINTMILSLLYRLTPQQCRLIMVDPKMLELSVYDGIPHLLTPVVTDPKKAVVALKWAVREMEDRYRKMAKLGVRNIDGFNARVQDAREKGETINCTVQAGFDRDTGELLYREEEMDLNPLPYIVIVVDEMADLMMVAGKEIEGTIQRLAQMARAAGIHLIMATQRPSVDVITGTIKANFPTRISFSVTSKIDSRTILGEQGAETLLGMGDMLFMSGGGSISRVHGAFVSDTEVEEIVSFLKTQGSPDYLATVTDGEEDDAEDAGSVAEIIAAAAANGGDDGEELYLQAVKIVMRDKKCSTSYIQRRLNIGYNKAATLVERMEDEGLVGVANHVGKREILFNQHG